MPQPSLASPDRTRGLAGPRPSLAVPLSQLPIWAMQRRYFEDAGSAAWRANAVPSYVTVNPYIAGAYAEMTQVLAAAQPAIGMPTSVIELGAGSGRFAHHFLDQYFRDEQGEPATSPRIRYLMTDISHANIAFWRAHERFRPFFAEGCLETAMLDVEATPGTDDDQQLLGSQARDGDAPIAVVANYLFDSLAQDVFRVSRGRLQQGLATLGDDFAADAKCSFAGLRLDYTWQDCSTDPYDVASWNALIARYADTLPRGAFPMPTSTLACLTRLRRLSGGRPLLVLACDLGHTDLTDYLDAEAPQPAVHGCFSFPVNFDALAAWTRAVGGLALLPTHPHASIAVAAFGFNLPADTADAIRQIYRREVTRFGPDDFFMVKQVADSLSDRMELRQILALLRLSGWDRAIFVAAYDRIVALLPEANERAREGLAAGLKTLWRRHLDLGEDDDLGFQVGSLLGGLGHPRDAIAPLEFSIARHGPDPAAVRNLETCRAESGGR